MVKLVIIIILIILAIFFLYRLKILNGYKKKYDEILITAAYKKLYSDPGECPKGYRLPTLKEFELLYNENEFEKTHKYILDGSIISNELEIKDH